MGSLLESDIQPGDLVVFESFIQYPCDLVKENKGLYVDVYDNTIGGVKDYPMHCIKLISTIFRNY